MGSSSSVTLVLLLLLADIVMLRMVYGEDDQHDYRDALVKSIMFFEGQRSGKLPSSQRVKWRKSSALQDGRHIGVDLVGGYYDAGDNLKFNFPMAFSTTMLAWGVLEFGSFMGPELEHAKEAIRWGTDYLLKATSIPGLIFVQVGDPYADHDCWQRPEDMDTPRTVYAVSKERPGSEVAAETAAALAASSIVFRSSDPLYSQMLLKRAMKVFDFADTYRGSYNDSLGRWVCPFYCDWSGYKDELLWGAAWLHKASNKKYYWNYVLKNMDPISVEFGWDNKDAGINVLIANDLLLMNNAPYLKKFRSKADEFVCSVLPESPTKVVKYSPGGLLFKPGGSNMQNPTALSFLLLAYAQHLDRSNNVVKCQGTISDPHRLVRLAKSQVDYILGHNPFNMSYMVGYGKKFPLKIHHRGSSLPSIDQHPEHIKCQDGTPFFLSNEANPNLLTGALVGGPYLNDTYPDSRSLFTQSEPATSINAPFVGVLAFFTANQMV